MVSSIANDRLNQAWAADHIVDKRCPVVVVVLTIEVRCANNAENG